MCVSSVQWYYGVCGVCFQAEDSIRELVRSRGLGDVYKRQPKGNAAGHVVRIYGNVDNTQLTYPGGQPAKAPSTIGAGQVVDLGVTQQAFEVVGDHEFAVGMFQLGAAMVDPGTPAPNQKGDPAQSQSLIHISEPTRPY